MPHNHDFQPGDLVRLRVGTRRVIVRRNRGDWITCEWLADGGLYQRASFARTSLVPAETDDAPSA